MSESKYPVQYLVSGSVSGVDAFRGIYPETVILSPGSIEGEAGDQVKRLVAQTPLQLDQIGAMVAAAREAGFDVHRLEVSLEDDAKTDPE